MDEYDDIETPITILPGVDLALWSRLLLLAVLLVAAAGTALALTR